MSNNNKNKITKEKRKMAVLTADCSCMFSVAEDKAEIFRNCMIDEKTKDKLDNTVQKVSRIIVVKNGIKGKETNDT